jgi:hypothetical protein
MKYAFLSPSTGFDAAHIYSTIIDIPKIFTDLKLALRATLLMGTDIDLTLITTLLLYENYHTISFTLIHYNSLN